MDSIFLLAHGDRAVFLQQMLHSFGCVHICLWSYLPHPSNCLLALDGLYRELSANQPPSSSSGSLARRLFDVYRESINYVETGRIPGFAFKNRLPYMELKLHDIQRMASNDVQLQFYQEAGIKTVVFMGCATGEIELGMSNDHPQMELEKEMRNLFPLDFSRQPAISGDVPNQPPSSSSSSIRSLSVDSPEYSPLLFNNFINPTTTTTTTLVNNQEPNIIIGETLLDETLRSSTPIIATTTTPDPHQPPTSTQIRNINITTEIEDAAMTKAILAVLTSPSTSSTTVDPNLLPPNISRRNPTAFRKYSAGAALAPVADIRRKNINMLQRAVLFFRNLNMRRKPELHVLGTSRPSTTQLHHMISERRRREKLNESFQVLKSLLPSGTKKDKASVLSSTTDYLRSLKSQVEELRKRNEMLESQIITRKKDSRHEDEGTSSSVDEQRINVEVTQVSSSTSEARFVDLRVTVRSEGNNMLDLVMRILDFLKQQRTVSLSSVDSNTRMLDSILVHEIMMRLKYEGNEFSESGFGEAVRRVVDDQPHSH